MIGVLVSGEGTNLQALLDAELPVAAVARTWGRAGAPGSPAAGIPPLVSLDDYTDRDDRDEAMASWLEGQGVELVVCAGYMQLLRPSFLARFPGRVVNVHPAPLPAFRARTRSRTCSPRVPPRAAATVHFVDEGVDRAR